jgi:FkbM family methyltransferase
MKDLPVPGPAAARQLLDRLAKVPPGLGPCPVQRPLVLYGAGKLGHLAAELFTALGIPVAYAVDRSPPPSGLLDDRIPVLVPEAVPVADRDRHLIAVCVVTAPYVPIRDFLLEAGWRHVRPVYDVLEAYADRLPMGNGWFAGQLSADDRAQVATVLDAWHDDESRAAHLQFLAWRVAREEWSFAGAPVRIDDRYFIEPVVAALGGGERFLDAGAHHGVVISRWLRIVDGHFQSILAVEADRDNAARLRALVAGLPADVVERIRVVECALAAKAGRYPFAHGMDLASRLMAGADGDAPACRLDDLDYPLTFGKIHLEGGELDALKGGVETLQRWRPILAVTVYHNRDGLWQTPGFLMGILPDYRFLMRLHAWCGTGAVVYAIPVERWPGTGDAHTT